MRDSKRKASIISEVIAKIWFDDIESTIKPNLNIKINKKNENTSTCACVYGITNQFLAIMKSKDEIIEIEIADIDLFLIDRVRDLRSKRRVSQVKLSIALGLAEGAVSKIENPKQRAKYNIRHINLLAKALSCTPADLLPTKPLKYDIVRVKLRILKNRQADGKPNYEVISKTQIAD